MRANPLIMIVLMAACADAGESGETGDPVELLDAISETYCAHLESCGVAAPEFIYSSCTQRRRSEEAAAKLREDIERGRAVWSREAAERCREAIAIDTCPIEPKLVQPDGGAQEIDLDLDDADACIGVLAYRNPGLPSLR